MIYEFKIPWKAYGQARHRQRVVMPRKEVMLHMLKQGQAPKIFSQTYKTKEQTAREKDLLALAKPHAPRELFTVPVAVNLCFHIKPVKSVPATLRDSMIKGIIPPAKKPDIDNMGKFVLDVFNGVFWKDDKLVVTLNLMKRYSEADMLEVRIATWDEFVTPSNIPLFLKYWKQILKSVAKKG